MSPTERVVTFRPDEGLLEGMEALKERDGIPYSEQIRRAMREWLQQKRVLKKPAKNVDRRQPRRVLRAPDEA